MSDNGEYFARIGTIDNNYSVKWQSKFKVPLPVKDLSVGVPDPVMEGSEVKLICNNMCSSSYNPTVMWTKNGQDLPVHQTNNNELILQSVSTEDEGNYSCALKQHEDHPSKPVELNVMFPPRVPSVSVSPASETLEGAAVTLTCSSDANPPVENYTWYRRTAAETVRVGTGERINFNLTSDRAGLYHCEAHNSVGSLNSTGVEVVWAGFGWKTATLLSSLGFL
ncbi:cell adhesion molecule CEACAM6-like [Alosa pseudoharengus]|uniref:cell adhesion molecule CEACAM6-like n=1 Tax=Alosa pseudoharengus TaxID=34774 RepID=UPI003F8AE554